MTQKESPVISIRCEIHNSLSTNKEREHIFGSRQAVSYLYCIILNQNYNNLDIDFKLYKVFH